MRNLLKLEEAAIFIFGFVLLWNLISPWWLLVILFFTPDLGALGYLGGPRLGAITYNTLHHKAVAIALIAIGFLSQNQYFQTAGLTIFAHSSFDRMLGLGLKYPDSFKHTHLDFLGAKAKLDTTKGGQEP